MGQIKHDVDCPAKPIGKEMGDWSVGACTCDALERANKEIERLERELESAKEAIDDYSFRYD